MTQPLVRRTKSEEYGGEIAREMEIRPEITSAVREIHVAGVGRLGALLLALLFVAAALLPVAERLSRFGQKVRLETQYGRE
jgi:hypothetical protein